MSAFFFPLNDPQYPPILKSCLEVYIKRIADSLYASLPSPQRYERMVSANIQGGSSDTVSRYNIDKFKQTNLVYPFTAFNVQEQTIDEKRKNYYGRAGKGDTGALRWSDSLDAWIAVIPYTVEIPLISFFSNPHDYLQARTKLQRDAASLTRYYVPLRINGRITQTCFNANIEVTKGQYAFEFEEYLRINKIFDVVHTSVLEYEEVIVDPKTSYSVSTKVLEVLSVDDIPETVDATIPYIVSISVSDDETAVIREPVQITFSEEMLDDEPLIDQSIYFTPESTIEYSWDDTKTILSVQPTGGFTASTYYILEILSSLVSKNYIQLRAGQSLGFTTGAA